MRNFSSVLIARYVLSSFSEFMLSVFLQYLPVTVYSFIGLSLSTRPICNFQFGAVPTLGRDFIDLVICHSRIVNRIIK